MSDTFTVLRPLAGRFIARMLTRKRSGLIEMPTERKENIAIVLAIGPPRRRDGEDVLPSFGVGDYVLVSQFHRSHEFEYEEGGEKRTAFVFGVEDPVAVVDPAHLPKDLEA